MKKLLLALPFVIFLAMPEKVPLCHFGTTMYVNPNAVAGHLGHGDYLGACVAPTVSPTWIPPTPTNTAVPPTPTNTEVPPTPQKLQR